MKGRQIKKIGTDCFLIGNEIAGLRSEDKAEMDVIAKLQKMNVESVGSAIEELVGDAAEIVNDDLLLQGKKYDSFIKKIDNLHTRLQEECNKLTEETKEGLQPLLDELYCKLHPNAACQSIIEDVQIDSNERVKNGLQLRLDKLLEKINGINRFKFLKIQITDFSKQLEECTDTRELSALSGEEFPKLEQDIIDGIFANFKSRLATLDVEYPEKKDKIEAIRQHVLGLQNNIPSCGAPSAGEIYEAHKQIKRLEPIRLLSLFHKRPSPTSSPSPTPSPSSSIKDESPSPAAASTRPSTPSS